MSKKLSTFAVMAEMTVCATINIGATSLEDAVAKVVSLKETDFITFKEDWISSDGFRITGVYENGK